MQCAVEVRPPEVAFPIVALGNNDPNWDVRSDIWSLGCTVGLPNFIQVSIDLVVDRFTKSPPDQPYSTVLTEAVYWLRWFRWSDRSHQHGNRIGPQMHTCKSKVRTNLLFCNSCRELVPDVSVAEANAYWAEHQLHLEKRCTIEEAERLIHLVRSMLVLDPAEQPSALQLLAAHSWLNEV